MSAATFKHTALLRFRPWSAVAGQRVSERAPDSPARQRKCEGGGVWRKRYYSVAKMLPRAQTLYCRLCKILARNNVAPRCHCLNPRPFPLSVSTYGPLPASHEAREKGPLGNALFIRALRGFQDGSWRENFEPRCWGKAFQKASHHNPANQRVRAYPE